MKKNRGPHKITCLVQFIFSQHSRSLKGTSLLRKGMRCKLYIVEEGQFCKITYLLLFTLFLRGGDSPGL